MSGVQYLLDLIKEKTLELDTSTGQMVFIKSKEIRDLIEAYNRISDILNEDQ